MGLSVKESIVISKPRQTVAEFVFDPENDPKWIGGIKEVVSVSDKPLKQGSQVHRLAEFMGKKIDYVLEIIAFEEAAKMEMKTLKGPFPMEVTYILEDDTEGCMVHVHIGGSGGGKLPLPDFIVKPMVSKQIKGDLQRLKLILES